MAKSTISYITQLWLKWRSAWFDSDSTHILDFHGRLDSDSTHLSQSRVNFDSRLMSRAQPCLWLARITSPSQTEESFEQSGVPSRASKSGSDQVWLWEIGSHCLPMLNLSKTVFWLPKADFRHLALDSSENQHFLLVLPAARAESNRAWSQAPVRAKTSRAEPRRKSFRAELSRTKLSQTSS